MTGDDDTISRIEAALEAGPTRIPVPSAPGYEADTSGQIWSVASNWRGLGARKMSPFYDEHGYLRVRVVVNGQRKKMAVHRMVCEAFHGQPPTGHEVRHVDGARNNNAPENLAWGTRSENAIDRQAHGTDRAAENGRLGAAATQRKFAHLSVSAVCASCGTTFMTRAWKVASAGKRGCLTTCSATCARRLGGISTARAALENTDAR